MDILILDGKIHNGVSFDPNLQSIAVKNDAISQIGTREEISKLAKENTLVIDAKGGTVLPGFVEPHAHPSIGGIAALFEIMLYGISGKDALLATIKEFVANHPKLESYSGSGFLRTDFDEIGPRKEWLDAIEKDKPVMIQSIDGHSLWVNSKALEMAGVDENTKLPKGANIPLDSKTGKPAGLIQGMDAMKLFDNLKVPYTVADYKKALLWACDYFNSEGFTTMMDILISIKDLRVYEAFKELAEENRLTMRVRGAWHIGQDMEEDAEMYLKKARKLSDVLTTPYFQMNTIKFFSDGVVEERTAYLLEPYCNDDSGWCGEPVWETSRLIKAFALAEKKGFQIHVHSIGDASARQIIDGFEALKKESGQKDTRHVIAHLEIIEDVDIDRMAKLGVVGLISPYWTVLDDTFFDCLLPYLGEERAYTIYKAKTFLDKNVVIATHSDYNVSEPEIDIMLYCAVTRMMPQKSFDIYCKDKGFVRSTDPNAVQDGNTMKPLYPEREGVTLDQVIKMSTIDAAYSLFMENEVGTIEVGKKADIILYEKDIVKIAADDIEQLCGQKPALTIFNGKVVFNKDLQ